MAIPQRRFGYLPDSVDQRDRPFAALKDARLSVAPAASADFRSLVPEILEQGDLGSCTAQASLGAIRLRQVLEGVNKPLLASRLHVYWGTRSYLGTVDWDSGGLLRDTFRFINSFGYMPESETINGYDVKSFQSPPTPQEQMKMFDQRDKADGQVEYYRIYDSGEARVDAIKRALSNKYPVVLGTDTTQAFLDYQNGILLRPSASVRSTGGHAFYLCGYNKDCAYVANSWGKDFGESGFMKLGWDYIKWQETRDIWVVAKAPYFSHLVGK